MEGVGAGWVLVLAMGYTRTVARMVVASTSITGRHLGDG